MTDEEIMVAAKAVLNEATSCTNDMIYLLVNFVSPAATLDEFYRIVTLVESAVIPDVQTR